MTKIVNIFGAPSSGKSTCAAELYAALKRLKKNVGLITEFATFKVLEKSFEAMKKQYYVTSKQLYNQEVFEANYDIVITDSPILLGIIYNNKSESSKIFNQFLLEKFKEKDNFNILLKSNIEQYSSLGRLHKKKEIKIIENTIKTLLNENNINYNYIYNHEILKFIDELK